MTTGKTDEESPELLTLKRSSTILADSETAKPVVMLLIFKIEIETAFLRNLGLKLDKTTMIV